MFITLQAAEHYLHDIIGYRAVNKKQSWLIYTRKHFGDILDV